MTRHTKEQRVAPLTSLNRHHVLSIAGTGLVLVALLLWVLRGEDAGAAFTLPVIASLLTCTVAYSLADLYAAETSRHLWAGYLNLAAMVAWLALGIVPGLLVVIAGPLLAALVRVVLPAHMRFARSTTQAAKLLIQRVSISGLGLLAAMSTAHLLAFTFPPETPADFAQVVLAILIGFSVIQRTGVSLFPGATLHEVVSVQMVLREGLLLAIVPALAITYREAGVIVFIALMGLSMAQMIRYHQMRVVQETLARRVSELTVLTDIAGTINVNLDSDESLEAIYRRVSSQIKVNTFVVTLFDNERNLVNNRFVIVDNMVRNDWPARPMDGTRVVDYVHDTREVLAGDRETLSRLGLSVPENLNVGNLLCVPLLVGEKALGALLITNSPAHPPFTEVERGILQSIAAQMSLAIRNSDLHDSHTGLARSVETMNRTLEQVVFNLDRADALRIAGEMAVEISGADRVGVMIYANEGEDLELVYMNHLDPLHVSALTAESGPNITVLTQPQARDIEDVDRLPHDHPMRELARLGNFRAVTHVPLRSGATIGGAIHLYYNAPHFSEPTRLRLLETLAYQVMAALDNAELLKALELYAAEQAQLVHLSRVSTSSLVLERLIAEITEIIRQMLSMDEVNIFLIGADSTTLERIASDDDEEQNYSIEFATLPELKIMRDQVHRNQRVFYHDDTMSDALHELMEWRAAQTLIILPMVANDAFQGIITLHSTSRRAFTDSEWRLAEMAANQVSTQLHNSQLFRETQHQLDLRLQELSLIEDLALDISSAPDTDQISRNVLEAATRATGAELAVIALRTGEGEYMRVISMEFDDYQWGFFEGQRLPESGVLGRVIQSHVAEIIPDNANDPDYAVGIANQSYRSSLAVPLISKGKAIGALNVESTTVNYFEDTHLRFLNNLAGHAVISIQNTELLTERQNRIETLTLLRDMSIRLATDIQNESVVDAILQTAIDLVQGEQAVLFDYDAENGKIAQLGYVKSVTENDLRATGTTYVPHIIAQQAADSREIIVIDDVEQHEYFAGYEGESLPYSSIIAAPMQYGAQVSYVLCVLMSRNRPTDESDRSAIELLSIQAVGHLENALLYQHIRADGSRRRAILDSARDGIIMLDREGLLNEANMSAESLLGIDLNEFLGQHFARTLMQVAQEGGFQEESATEALREMARVLRLEPQRITTRSFEVRRGGTVRYIEEVGSPVFDSEHNIIGRLLTLRDVTEDRLIAAYRDEITNMVVHDLRSPLGSIISSIVLAKEILSDPDDAMQDVVIPTLDISLDSATNLMDLVDNLLDIAKLETRRMPLKPGPTIVRELAEKAYTTLANSIREANVTVDVAVPDDLPLVDVDAEKLRRVLINLLDNAIRYTPTGTTVQIGAELQGRKVKVHVADSGTGIPADARDRVFEKFTQIKENKPQHGRKGTGLGLTFCKLVLEAHGERIWVESSGPLPGASFAFTLPVLADSRGTGEFKKVVTDEPRTRAQESA